MNLRVRSAFIFIFLLSGCQAVTPSPTATPTLIPTETVMIPSNTPAPVAGQTRTDEKGIEQVWVPAGSFSMGADSAELEKLASEQTIPGFILAEFRLEKPRHPVEITRGYWIDKYEVTNKAFGAFVNDGGYKKKEFWSEAGWAWLETRAGTQLPRYCSGNQPDHPIACITWYEAEAYARWRSPGQSRLPTEAEWEFAARGPDSNVYPWGNEFDAALCNILDSHATVPVGSYPGGVSWVGAHDMAGNVMEWVQDWLANHTADPATDPTGPQEGKIKVEKGGWWGAPTLTGRASYRHFEDPPEYADPHIGFRVVTVP